MFQITDTSLIYAPRYDISGLFLAIIVVVFIGVANLSIMWVARKIWQRRWRNPATKMNRT